MKRYLPLLFALLLLLFSACTQTGRSESEQPGTPIYFLAPTESVKGCDALQCSMESLNLPPDASIHTQAVAITERLLLGSSDGLLYSPFPEDTKLISVTVQERRIYVDLAGSFSRMDGIALTLADYCLTLSLSGIDGVESVTLTSSGRMLAQQPRQVFRERDVMLSTNDSMLQLVDVLLYFVDENGSLTPERRTLEVYEGDTRSGNLIAALLDGPASENLFPIIPEQFTISSIKVEDGVCRINLPGSSLSALPEDEAEQRLILLSLTESLYSLDSIQEVRFSADGVEIQKFGSIPLADFAMRPEE